MSGVRKTVEIKLCNFVERLSRLGRMRSSLSLAIPLLLAMGFASTPHAVRAQVNVTTYHNDIGRTGQNLSETILNTSNVTPTQFGKLFSQTVDGEVYAQPLYLSGITVNGATHNVLFVATENDSVYAFDADTNGGSNSNPLWKASLLSIAYGAAAGATTVPSTVVGYDIQPQIGITGTPVIDPANGTLYVVSKTMESGNAVQRLHALDVTTGLEKFGGPVVITASVTGTGNGSVNGTLTFDPLWQNQRPGLLLLNGIVYVGFASHGDNGPWHGWIIGYNENTLAQTGAYCASPNGTGSGFWMSGAGLAADQLNPTTKPFGRMFVATGNGDYNATSPYNGTMDYGDSDLDLDLTNGVPTITDEFTTYEQATLDSEDGDVGSGGLIVLPTQTTGPYPHLAVQSGKQGWLYLLNRDNLGGYSTTADTIAQELEYAVGKVGVWSTPAYWNGNVYYWGVYDYLKDFVLTNGQLALSSSLSSETYGYPGSTPSISADGTSQGIVWSIDSEAYGTPGPSILQAHSASNVAVTLYSSATNAARDSAGNAVKFTVPTIANGKVYVGAAAEVDIYGLLAGVTQTAAPIISPGTETYIGTLSVSITDSTPGASIYYTSNGTEATTSSTLYTGPITVSTTESVNAIATASGLLTSAQTSATYTNLSQATAVVFSLPTGTYGSAQTLSLSDTTANTSIYYTTDGSTPTASSTLYTGPIAINSTETISAIAVAPQLANSPVISDTYTIELGATGINFGEGFANSTGIIALNGYAQLNDSRLQLTDGLTGEAGSAWYETPVNIQTFTNDFTFQLSNPKANGFTFTIQNDSTSSIGGNGSALGYAPLAHSVAIKFDFYTPVGQGTDSTGLYVNGATPTTPAIDMSTTGINLLSGDEMAVHMVYNGTTLTMTITDMVTAATWSTSWTINISTVIGSNTAYVGFTGATGGYTASQKILTWSFVSSAVSSNAATPTFSPAAGTYTTAQTVSISDATSGATIYYTTNGTTPTTSSTVYGSPITVSANETIEAIAAVSGSTTIAQSAVGNAAYVIAPPAATPTFSVAAGTYTSTQTVSIADATTGATIYYTTNGATPTTSSTVYSGAITVSASETIQAIATATGYSTSTVASAAYTISTATQVATPTFSPAGGVYYATQTVTISDATPGATIYWIWTSKGTPVSTSSYKYSGPIAVGNSNGIEAIAVAPGLANSNVATATYNLTDATPVISLASGTYNGPQTVTITSATPTAKIYYTTNGATPTENSQVTPLYTGPITISASETLKVIADETGFTSSPVVSATYVINTATAAPTFSVAAGTYTSVQTVAISDTTAGATIYYTTNGTTPTPSSAVYSGAITVGATETINAIAVATGYASSAVASAAYTITLPPATPVFSLAAGSYIGAQTVSISDTTAGTTIYYTTNGATPTTSSTVYSGAITVSASETINAIATKSGYPVSSVASAAYTITPQVATPTFSPAGGVYYATQTVTISDATPGATIYWIWTSKGTPVSTSSYKYSGPIAVGNSNGIEAIAVAPGLANSNVATATYNLTDATPVISLASGTYNGPQTVTITSATPTAKIYYTTNGATPTENSQVTPLYTGPITISASETLKVIADETGFTSSPVVSATYVINTATAAPTFSVAAGTYTSAQSVSLSDLTTGATIYYTTNGTTPSTSSTVYSGPITVSATETLQAIAIAAGLSSSAVSSAAYTINIAAPTVNFASGFTASSNISLVGATIVGGALQLTDGNSVEARAAWYPTPVNVQAFTTSFTFKLTSATADGFTFCLQNSSHKASATGGNGFDLGYGGIASSVAVKFDLYNNAGEGSDSTGFYTSGAVPTVPALDMTSSGVNLHSGDVMLAVVTYDGTTLTLTLTDTVTNSSYKASSAVNIPVAVGGDTAYVGFTGGSGGLTAIQNILTWTYTVN